MWNGIGYSMGGTGLVIWDLCTLYCVWQGSGCSVGGTKLVMHATFVQSRAQTLCTCAREGLVTQV